jgi:hypothetical protein
MIISKSKVDIVSFSCGVVQALDEAFYFLGVFAL